MDIAFLHIMETFREGAGAFLNDFLYQITMLGDRNTIHVLLAVVYWCISKEFGTYLFMGYHWNRLINGFLKVTVCAYRPWVRDPTLIPDERAVVGATGYSFPSGHSMNAASVFGGLGVSSIIMRPLRIAGFAVVLLIGFSRLYMCVHTPQDVIAGFLIGCLIMYMTVKLLPAIERSRYGDYIAASVSIALAVVIAIYASVKSYPVDYDASGNILVDGAKMAVDTYKAVGWNLGFFLGWIIERRFVKFSSDGSISERSLRFICGLILYYFIDLSLLPLIKTAIGGTFGTITSCALQMLFIVLIYPVLIKLFSSRSVPSDKED